MDLKSYIRDVADFPIPGVLFRDITPLLLAPDAFERVLEAFGAIAASTNVEAVVGIESRGFIFGAPTAARLGLPFVPVRKPGKLPAARMTVEYALEYGSGQLDIHADAVTPGTRTLIVDDVLATGGTAHATAKLVELIGGIVTGFVFVIELQQLEGRMKLANYPVHSLISFE